MFLTNWLVYQVIAAGVSGAIEYPTASDFFLHYNTYNKLYFSGDSRQYVSNLVLYRGEEEYPINKLVSNIYVSGTGNYVAYVQICGETYVTNTVSVPSVNSGGLEIGSIASGQAAFFNGNFSDDFGDGTVTAAANNGRFYRNTPTGSYRLGQLTNITTVADTNATAGNVVYTFTTTPTVYKKLNNILMVGGGGSGGGTFGGGGGGGGLLFYDSGKISGDTVRVSVGSGGNRSNGWGGVNQHGLKGGDSTITGLPLAIGGGGGSTYLNQGTRSTSDGGSGGGGADGDGPGTGTAGPPRQGYNGGAASGRSYAGGGGGAGEAGEAAPGGTVCGDGGDGLNWSNLFPQYGDGGWFSGGGGGGTENINGTPGGGGQGGGGQGGRNSVVGTRGLPNTGGGGGGAGWSTDNTMGGSGMVIFNYEFGFPTPSIETDGINKLQISNILDTVSSSRFIYNSNSYDAGGRSIFYVTEPGTYTATATVGEEDYIIATTDFASIASTVGIPRLLFDGYNRLYFSRSVSDTTLTIGTDTYDIGEASNIFIQNPGRYEVFSQNNATSYMLDSNTVTAVSEPPNTSVFPSNQTSIIQSSGSEGKGQFGFSVDVYGDYMVVGAPVEDPGGTSDGGAAYIYKYDGTGWNQQTRLVPGDLTGNDRFGYSVGISGDYVIVGAAVQGAVYVYKRSGSTWSQEAKITGTNFGSAISIDGDYIIIGDETDSSNKGIAYIYKRSGTSWSLTGGATLSPSDTNAGDYFGHAVSISGTTAVVTSQYKSVSATGKIYIFELSGGAWSQVAKLNGDNDPGGESLGTSVSVYDNYAVLGGLSTNVYVFYKNGGTWTQHARVTVGGITTNDKFGCSVSLYKSYLLVGASNVGRAYVFRRDGASWNLSSTLTPSPYTAGQEFAADVSMYEDAIEIGSWNNGVNIGAVYDYQRPESDAVKLVYDGFNTLCVKNAEAGTLITFIEDTGTYQKFMTCDATSNTFPVPRSGTFNGYTKGSTGFSFLNDVLVEDYTKTVVYPPDDGTVGSLTTSEVENVDSSWIITGSTYGNGGYTINSNVTSVSGSDPYKVVNGLVTSGFDTSNTSASLTLNLHANVSVYKYVLWPLNAAAPSPGTPGSSTSLTTTESQDRPKSWQLETSQNGTDWTVVHTVTNTPISIKGDIYSITSPTSAKYYRFNITENNGGTNIKVGEIELYGSTTFIINFSDGWTQGDPDTTATAGTGFTLPTFTSTFIVVQGGYFDNETAGTYIIRYFATDPEGVQRVITRTFILS